jgi:Transposase
VAHERLTEDGWARIQAGDPAGGVGAAYLAKELLRKVYTTTTSERLARRWLERFYAHCRNAKVVERRRLAATVRRWEHQILGWHRTGLSNGPTEAMNLLIKKIKRVSATASATSRTIAFGYCCTAASNGGTLDPSHESEAANHAWSRRALSTGSGQHHYVTSSSTASVPTEAPSLGGASSASVESRRRKSAGTVAFSLDKRRNTNTTATTSTRPRPPRAHRALGSG